jgi:predicted transglutaminase-like cysteine proteinase
LYRNKPKPQPTKEEHVHMQNTPLTQNIKLKYIHASVPKHNLKINKTHTYDDMIKLYTEEEIKTFFKPVDCEWHELDTENKQFQEEKVETIEVVNEEVNETTKEVESIEILDEPTTITSTTKQPPIKSRKTKVKNNQ